MVPERQGLIFVFAPSAYYRFFGIAGGSLKVSYPAKRDPVPDFPVQVPPAVL